MFNYDVAVPSIVLSHHLTLTKSLMLFDMSSNYIGGEIPANICHMRYLQHLDTSRNLFHGILAKYWALFLQT
ncbi:hypothetical protein SADUNF_Sadunf03G0167200 [Salix dunnii]|uniref:Uncharacterized protein n=1 Tax=Salix dunnii TaxID=1413687 RepID=A0A835TEQ3_9ROSI|nr:hypothetical protein SADUNF_Sadunf03G0167200 [Salix dunnii]